MRADALHDLARHALGCKNTTIIVRMSLEDLTTGEGLGSIDGTDQPVSVGELRRLAGDASIIPAVLGGPSEVLDQGRTKRMFTAAQRLALIERDGGCAKCHAPPEHCEAHHIDWWDHGGPTDLVSPHHPPSTHSSDPGSEDSPPSPSTRPTVHIHHASTPRRTPSPPQEHGRTPPTGARPEPGTSENSNRIRAAHNAARPDYRPSTSLRTTMAAGGSSVMMASMPASTSARQSAASFTVQARTAMPASLKPSIIPGSPSVA